MTGIFKSASPKPALVVGLLALAVLVAACGPRVERPEDAASRPDQRQLQPGALDAAGADDAEGGLPEGLPDAGDEGADGSADIDAAPEPSGNGAGGADTSTAQGSSASPDGGATGPRDTSPIMLGAVGTRSGLVGEQGAGVWASLEAWAASVNARGGLDGRPIELITVDDGADPGRHAAAVRRLVQEREVVAFVGPYAPLTFSAGIPTLEEFGVPVIGGDSAEKGYFSTPMAFPFNGAALPEGRAAGIWAGGNLPARRAAVFYVAEIEFGNTVAQQFRQGWEAAGKQVPVYAAISLGQPDFTAEILRAQGANADLVVVYTDFSGCRRFWDAARRQRYRPTWFSASSCFRLSAADAGEQTVDRFYATLPIEPPFSDIPAMVDMREAMARFKPDFVNPHANGELPRGWASGKLFERAVEVAGGRTDSPSLIAALESMRDETVFGLTPPLDWPAGQPRPERPCGKILHLTGSGWTTVTPEYIC